MFNNKNYNILYGFTTLVGVTLIILILTWISHYKGGFAWTSEAEKEFNWHPFLMVLGLVFLYSQSILIYRTGRHYLTKKTLKYIHATLHLLAFVASVVGLQAIFDNHNQNGYKHLISLHSWIGLVTVIIFSFQFLSGFITFLHPGLPGSIRKTLMPFHVALGIGAFVMAIVATVAGLTEEILYTIMDVYDTLPPQAYVFNFMGLLTVVYGVLTLYLVTKADYKRIPLPED